MSYPLSELTGPPWVDSPTIWDAFCGNVDSQPDALALACVHQATPLLGLSCRSNPYLRWTYSEFNEGVQRLVAAWRLLGVREGSMLATFALNSAEFMLTAWAAVKMGCIMMPISPRNLTNAEEIAHMVKTGLLVAREEHAIVFAGTTELAKVIDEMDLFPGSLRIVVADTIADVAGWVAFQQLMTPGKGYSSEDFDQERAIPASEQGGTVLFTSGTTSMPKGVYVPFERGYPRMLWGVGGIKHGSKVVAVMPNNHAMGYNVATMILMLGAAIILPGPAFEPAKMLETMYAEEATHTVLVPTMIYALVAAKAANPGYANRPLSHLESVLLGGSGVMTEHLRLIMEELGAKGTENVYGSTEGLMVSSGHAQASEVASIVDGEDVCCGQPIMGSRIKIVDPETGETLPMNVLGEIHGFGLCMPKQYIGEAGEDAWYEDEKGQRWFKTGDQGRVDEQGRLFVTGRYKDMIIRGGENISPSAIEAVLLKHPLLSPVLPQIVAAKDSIAGEVPVAVIIGKVTPEIRGTIQSEIVHHMGPLYVPEDVISTEDLGLDDFPRTTSGKVQKTKIRQLVDKYLSKPSTTDVDLVQVIKSIWAGAVGLDPAHVRPDAPIGEFADSITIMRVRERIKKQTGKVLSLAAMAEAGTIEKQIKLLQSMEARSKAGDQKTRVDRPKREGPPGVEDMAHLTEESRLLEPTKELVVSTISKHGFGWDDVEDIMPAYDFVAFMSQTRLMESWTWEFALQPITKVDKTQLRKASEAIVINHRIFASFMVWDAGTLGSDLALHVVLKQSSKFFDLVFEDGGELETIDDLKNITEDHPHPEWVNFPGPMARFILYDIKETGGAALAISANHAVMDASMMQLVQEDLDRAVVLAAECETSAEIVSQLPAHVDYKVWADSYYNLRTSSVARAATKWHVKRLQSVADHVTASNLPPPKPPASRGPDPTRFSFEVPDIHKLRREHPDIMPTILVKAAVALVEVERLRSTHAVFNNLEAARTYFPFLPKSMLEQAVGSSQFEGTDVSGPTFQMVFNVVAVDRSGGETVLEFLKRMQEDQTGLTKHASAPLMEIMKEVARVNPGAGQVMARLVHTAHFNWAPGLGQTGSDPLSSLKLVHAVNRPTTGLVYHAGLAGEKNQTVFLDVYAAQPGDEEVEAALLGRKAMAITKWLVTSANWNVPLGEFTNALKDL